MSLNVMYVNNGRKVENGSNLSCGKKRERERVTILMSTKKKNFFEVLLLNLVTFPPFSEDNLT